MLTIARLNLCSKIFYYTLHFKLEILIWTIFQQQKKQNGAD